MSDPVSGQPPPFGPVDSAAEAKEREARIIVLHNQSVGPIVASIIAPMVEAGGNLFNVLGLAESVLLGVILYATDHGMPDDVVDIMHAQVANRLQQFRRDDALRAAPPAGHA